MSFWIKAEEVPLYIQEIIFTKLQALPEPYMYSLRGTAGASVSTYASALAAVEKLTKWVKSVHGDTVIVYHDFNHNLKQRKCRFKLEITDPASKAIDELIKVFRGNLYNVPEDRMIWTRYREKVGI